MANTKVTKIMMRNGTQQEWINADSVASLEIGEIGFESDTYRMKIGNTDNDTIGSLFKDLDYFAAGIVSVQEVDATHENGLMVDSNGVLELNIGNLVGRVDHHDTIFAEHADSIEGLYAHIDTIKIELDRIEIDHHDSIENLVDSIQLYVDSVTVEIKDSVTVNTDNIQSIFDSVADLDVILDTKVDKSGDTMTGPLVFEGNGIIGTENETNLILTSGSTFINNLLEPRQGMRVNGTIIETNDSYHAVSEEDIVDVKSLKDINLDINKPVMRTKIADGGKLFRSDMDNGRIVYRPSIPLKDISLETLSLIGTLSTPTDSVTAELIDIIENFMNYIHNADTVESSLYESPVEFDTEE